MTPIHKLNEQVLENVCNILGDTHEGLTGSEIGTLLSQCRIKDPNPSMTKRKRLYLALQNKQNKDGCAKNIFAFIQAAINPVSYVSNKELFEARRGNLNRVLAFEGYQINKEGKVVESSKAKTIDQAKAKAKAALLREKLEQRNVHPDVLRFCRAELIADDYFHAVFESTKSLADKIRNKSGLDLDGSPLVDKAFGLGKDEIPTVAFNTLQTETEKSEHKGIMNLLKGIFGAVRNVTAHEPRIHWSIDEQDALDILTLASLLHRRLDNCVKTNLSDQA